MPDTAEEIATALKDCSKCKYAGVCELYKEWARMHGLKCIMGVKR